MSYYLWLHGQQPTRLLCPWKSPSKNTGVDCHSLLQGIFLTQGLNPGLLHCRQILYHLSHQGNPSMFLVLNIPCFFLPHYLSVFVYTVSRTQSKEVGTLIQACLGTLLVPYLWLFENLQLPISLGYSENKIKLCMFNTAQTPPKVSMV